MASSEIEMKIDLKKGSWSVEEDHKLVTYINRYGIWNWSLMPKFAGGLLLHPNSKLPGRTDNDIKNYWHSHLKKYANEQNQVSQTNKQNDHNSSSPFENMQHADHMTNVFKSHFSCKQDMSSSSSTTTSKDAEVEFRADYNDTSSPETFDDLHCFWEQLCPFENLELKNIHRHMDAFSNHNFQDLDDGLLCSYTLSNNDYNSSLLSDP
ncbi:hypothetical protein QVD17_36928 [Tagetes erecta]|uniref:Homeodomain-like protein n=1 Tax=Tagetes erecta TaxID=13708 RepID=A0AAD8JVK8_TARER|nr:hypothetical protein QVD17_36928 [Tagetes erecta]